METPIPRGGGVGKGRRNSQENRTEQVQLPPPRHFSFNWEEEKKPEKALDKATASVMSYPPEGGGVQRVQ